ncbi:leucyl aminopeptidase family protein [Halioxenophilus sp. WMMB6]|uniref:leucyl aminopeptidase family protein n=1 Tax=Halioxenophilus sp. WMMB6 TaxID=3073815 RepID=UPI00295E947B|nr:leucyl aminopeptidase family protein [Halioxenophilus sp. WMMB6]
MTEPRLTQVTQLAIGNEGTPLRVDDLKNYQQWLEQQPESTQSWLTNSGYKGKGVSLLPGAEGRIDLALFFVDTEDYFCCGDLATALPDGAYQLVDTDPSLTDKIAFGWLLGSYKFSHFKTKKDENAGSTLYLSDAVCVDKATHMARGVYLVRDLINTPADSMMPQHMASCAERLAGEFNADFSQWIDGELLEHNFPTIHTVGKASEHPPRLLQLTWGDPDDPKVTIIGKGVCFDSGGMNLKPSQAMRLMKKDMGGAAHALGMAYLIMAFKLPIRLTMLIPAVENAIGGNAFRPGDVIYTRKGISVEIDNTDAEGRLVLCDALAKACDDQPELIVDFATLTGAARVALGTELPAMFCNDKTVALGVTDAGESCGDPVWQLPLHKPYRSFLQTEVADLLNCATSPFGGAITAALFLQEFVTEKTPWLHFDVMAWNNRKLPGRPTGGEAMGLRAVFTYLANHYK